MNKNTSSESSGGGKMKSEELFSFCTLKNCKIHGSLNVNDDADFEESLYKKPKPINRKTGATCTGDVERKKNAGKTVSSSAVTEPDSDNQCIRLSVCNNYQVL
jgi:hypothetical protein